MKKNKEIKKYTPEELKQILLATIQVSNNKESLLKEFEKNILPDIHNSNYKGKEETIKEKSVLLLRIFESDSQIALMESFTEAYQMLSSEMTKSMIKEFSCTNEAEKALVELVVNSYVRTLDNSRRLNNELECKQITPNRNIYIANLSKQIDRAHRQFISSLLTLKQLKTPSIEMKIQANTAFVSNNQQINLSKDENINA